MSAQDHSTPGSLKRIRPLSPSISESSSCSTYSESASSHALSSYDSRRTRGAPLRIAIEGNIAAGKSTFIQILHDLNAENPGYHWYVQPEPLSKWTKKEDDKKQQKPPSDDNTTDQAASGDGNGSGGGNLLEAFYKNPKRWAYTFEAYAFVTRMKQAKDADREVNDDLDNYNTEAGDNHNAITFFERSVYSARMVFAENSYESGYMDTTEWSIYCDWTNYVLKNVKQLKLDGIIYLQCDPKKCAERMAKRSRSEEGGVPYEYLEALDKKHEDWLVHKKKLDIHKQVHRALEDVPVLVLGCTDEFETNKENRDGLLSKTRNWLADIISKNDKLPETTTEESSSDVFADITNNSIFRAADSKPASKHSSTSTDKHIAASDDEENEAPSLPKIFRKQETSVADQ